MGKTYCLFQWLSSNNYRIFNCKQKDITTNAESPPQSIILTDNIFLHFENKNDVTGEAVLVSWSFLYSLIRVQVQEAHTITLTWITKENLWSTLTQVFVMEEESKTFAKVLKERIDKAESVLTGEYKVLTGKEISERINDQDIKTITGLIEKYESLFKKTLLFTTFDSLTALYNKVFTRRHIGVCIFL